MAFDSDEKTEAPTPRRRKESREKGQVARSQDLSAAVLLFVALWGLKWFGPPLWRSMVVVLRAALTADSPTTVNGLLAFSSATVVEIGKRLAPFLMILFVAVLAALTAQVGLLLTGQPLIPSLSKINPLNGIKRLFSMRMVMMSFLNIGKLLLVTVVAVLTFSDSASAILYAYTLGSRQVLLLIGTLTFQLGIRISVVLLVLALLDFAWQRHKHEKDMRMTKEEVKDELRSMDGDPKLKARRRQVQMQLAMQRLKKDVATADVVVTNPTHVAVAIRYEVESMAAPKVVAKGADYVALRIRQLAAEFGIPVVERKPLARALYESVEVGQFIPERFYRAIAEILAYVYELSGRPPAASRRNLVEA